MEAAYFCLQSVVSNVRALSGPLLPVASHARLPVTSAYRNLALTYPDPYDIRQWR